MDNYFTITTTPDVAEKIRKQFEWYKKMGIDRSIKLGEIKTQKGLASEFSIVQIVAKKGKIIPSDIFFLGLFSASQ